MTLNFAAALRDSARRYPSADALVGVGPAVSYAELDDASNRAAGLFASAGLRRGDRVVMVMPNVPAFAVAYFGALKLGAVAVPLNPLVTSDEIARVLKHSQARMLVAHEACLQSAASAAEATGVGIVLGAGHRAPDGVRHFESELAAADAISFLSSTSPNDVAVLLYTSGTTGNPKAVGLCHSNISWAAHGWQRGLSYRREDRILAAIPLSFSMGLCGILNASVFTGSSVALWATRFEPDGVLDLVARERVTVLLGVPTMHAAFVASGDTGQRDVGSVRMAGGAGANLPSAVASSLRERFQCFVGQGYGLTETSALVSLPSPELDTDPASVGVSAFGVEVRVVDPDSRSAVDTGDIGEITARGPGVMTGYLDDPAATAGVLDSEGWFSTGDLGRLVDTGEIYLVDRLKELIIRGGINVYPSEIEAVLCQHPAVRLAAVVGLPDDRLGEEIGAAVVIDDPGVTEADLLAWARDRIPPQKYPRRFAIVDELPLGATGKVLKKSMDRDQLFSAAEELAT
jgi:long-chain acyl-CoA synthetase